MLSFMWWMVVGVIAGGLARGLIPGRQAMGLFSTMILGLIGSMVGGYISSLIWGHDPRDPGFHAGGLIMSSVGAFLVLAAYLIFSNRRDSRTRL